MSGTHNKHGNYFNHWKGLRHWPQLFFFFSS